MAFVPEGQADSKQERSAWVVMQRGPCPGGTVEVVVSPTDFCRRNEVHAGLETLGIPVERMLASNPSRDPFNRPAGTGLFYK
jgi:hypothetical protein